MEDFDLIIIKGRAGSGKTVLAQKLAAKYGYHVLEIENCGSCGDPQKIIKSMDKPLIIVSQGYVEVRNAQKNFPNILEVYMQPHYNTFTYPRVNLGV